MTIKKNYDDIIDYEYKGSASRPKMPLSSRAKIFMPFAALRGYEELMEKTRLEAEKSHEPKTSNLGIIFPKS